MKLCSSCKGDGLKHPHPDIFQIVEDRPCYECGGRGIVLGLSRIEEGLDGVPYVEVDLKIQQHHTARVYYETIDINGREELDIVEILISSGREWRILNASELNRKILVAAAYEHYQQYRQKEVASL